MKKIIIIVIAAILALAIFGGWLAGQKDCGGKNSREKLDCVKEKIDSLLSKREVGPALNYLQEFRLKDSRLTDTDCHGLAHYIGDKAYGFYENGQSLSFDDNANLCGYGFYHAFITAFVLAGQPEAARAFCQTLEVNSPIAAYSCYHGLGHGSIHLFEEDFLITDSLKIISEGVNLCEQVLPGAGDKFEECLAGVYDGIGDIVLRSDHINDPITPQELFSWCKVQPEANQSICFDNLAHLVYRKTQRPLGELVSLVVNDSEIIYKDSAVRGLALIYVVDNINKDLSEGVKVCRSLTGSLKDTCINTMGFKVFADAPVDKRQETASQFCSQSGFSESEQEVCFAGVAKAGGER